MVNMSTKYCYVCRELVDCDDLAAIQVATKYTKTPVSELIQSLLRAADDLRRIEASDIICSRCLHKFNQYDLARLTVQRVETELMHALLGTHVYWKQEATDNSETDVAPEKENALEDDAYAVDGQEYQHEYENEIVEEGSTQGDSNDNNSDEEQIVYVVIDEESEESETEGNNRLEISLCGKAEPYEVDWQRQYGMQAWLENIDGNEKEVHCKYCKVNVPAMKNSLIVHGQSRPHILNMSAQRAPETFEAATVSANADLFELSGPKKRKRSMDSEASTATAEKNKTPIDNYDSTLEKLPVHSEETDEVVCQLCDRKTSTADLAQHIRSHQSATIFQSPTGEIVLRCDICLLEELTSEKMCDHIALHDNKFKCAACDKVFSEKRPLRTHCRKHAKAKHRQRNKSEASMMNQNACPFCSKILISKSFLTRHMLAHKVGTLGQSDAGQSVLQCNFCHHEERNDADLKSHLAMHGEKPKCLICGAVFMKAIELRYHMRIHSGKTFYQCDKCGKGFIHDSSLKAHLGTVHAVERTMQCDVCPKSFKRKIDLDKHMLTHSGEKKHACPECGKRFSVGGNMRAHYKLHFGISSRSGKHICIICNTKFERPSQLEQHCIKIHSRATTEESNAEQGL